jgi:hypothetical protein
MLCFVNTKQQSWGINCNISEFCLYYHFICDSFNVISSSVCLVVSG